MLQALVVCGPSGVGKGAVIAQLRKRMPCYLSRSVTTRAPRPNEKDGEHYDYIDAPAFAALEKANFFAEYNHYNSASYGTPVAPFTAAVERGECCIFDIDINGARQLRENFGHLHMRMIFLLPDSMDSLARRLIARGDDPADIQKRMNNTRRELEELRREDGFIDAYIANKFGELKATVTALDTMIQTDNWPKNRELLLSIQ